MKAKDLAKLSALTVSGLLLCLPLWAQDVPDGPVAQEVTAEERELLEDPPQVAQPAEEAAGENATGESTEEQSASESPESATDDPNRAGAEERTSESMPKTASPLALVALMGAASFAGGLGLRRYRRR
ncbi:MAG TPA: hypothetical protein PKJ99_11855 [Thermoanaerobaculales bacterium]|nr:hypothetical protein [Thermoanaerobaculales bacterium]HPA79552.1 hypothetical protein [Thermoanaerobaculales bacterium]HQL31314.1 hypothetical protein [Thermoanaerobaculales bacterium]HQN95359.1 hypothetical protein [Thermoanaerobaculales bacterium]HQP42171.1 hypothetical protein [Thermoanaerobaculales bacterium]